MSAAVSSSSSSVGCWLWAGPSPAARASGQGIGLPHLSRAFGPPHRSGAEFHKAPGPVSAKTWSHRRQSCEEPDGDTSGSLVQKPERRILKAYAPEHLGRKGHAWKMALPKPKTTCCPQSHVKTNQVKHRQHIKRDRRHKRLKSGTAYPCLHRRKRCMASEPQSGGLRLRRVFVFMRLRRVCRIFKTEGAS